MGRISGIHSRGPERNGKSVHRMDAGDGREWNNKVRTNMFLLGCIWKLKTRGQKEKVLVL